MDDVQQCWKKRLRNMNFFGKNNNFEVFKKLLSKSFLENNFEVFEKFLYESFLKKIILKFSKSFCLRAF